MTAPVDGRRLYNQGRYVEDQVMLLDAILLTSFTNNKAEYNSVCGKLRGYQKGSHAGFSAHASSHSINAPYLDGISMLCW